MRRWLGYSAPLIWLSLCLLSLAACSGSGFQLRGSDSPITQPLKGKVVILSDAATQHEFSHALRRALQKAGALVQSAEAEPDTAGIRLNITQIEQDKTVSAYSSVRQVREFNHFIIVSFTAKADANSEALVSQVRAERSQVYDSRYVLGVAEEAQQIKAELRAEAARLLALRLRALP